MTPSTPAPAPTSNYLDLWMESLARVTLAGLAGAMVGLSRQQKEKSRAALHPTLLLRNRRKVSGNIPMATAISFTVFAWVVETSRRMSPVSTMVHQVSAETPLPMRCRNILVTVGDFGIGGTIAGLSGAVASGSPILSGMRLGLGIALVAGGGQAALDEATLYLEDQARKSDQEHQSLE